VRLDPPGRAPLPDDVRHRALGTVLAGLDDAPPRRGTALPLAVAAAVAAVLVSIGLTVGPAGPTADPAAPPPGTSASPPAPPAPPVSPSSSSPTDAERCAALARDLPGTDPRAAAETSVTAEHELGSDRVLVLDDALACLATPDRVTVSEPGGTPVGEATVSRLGPAVVAVHNPLLRRVDVAELPGVTVLGAPTAPVRLVLLPGPGLPDIPVRVAGSFDGLLPEPAPPAATERDRVLPVRPAGTAEDADLDACLDRRAPWQDSRGELFVPVLRHEPGGGRPPVLLARIGDTDAGLCTLRADGPQFDVVPLDPATTVQTAPGADWATALLVVPAGTRSADVAGDPCSLGEGLALCTGVDEGATVTLVGPDGPTRVVLPAPP
jgi:hypothetical protein